MNSHVPDAPGLIADREHAQPSAPPVLPQRWQAQFLLTPFGDATPELAHYDQLVVADVTYESNTPAMRVSLYLTESLQYFDFVFTDQGWYWLFSTPGGPVTGHLGPFTTSLKVPAPDFIGAHQGRFGNTWPILGAECDGWVIPTDEQHGTWYSFRKDTGHLSRIFTFDNDNPVKLPVLGSYYLANVAAFVEEPSVESPLAHIRDTPVERDWETAPNELVTQRDLQSALAHPPYNVPCTLQQVQALIPGFEPAPSGKVPLPVWTDQTFIRGWTLGEDFIPYYTLVYYWYSYGRQKSLFYGLGSESGKGNYKEMLATCLHSFEDGKKESYTNSPQYMYENDEWTLKSCAEPLKGLGVPRPDWMEHDNGQIAASITGNPEFGCKPGETLHLIRCPLERAPGEEALFWVWYTATQEGVLFTEANFVNSTDHSLQLVDYAEFKRNATWMNPEQLSDPCPEPGA